MKKIFAVFMVFLSAGLPAFCASTCETRVDKHQDATTTERVDYCLMPEEKPAPAAGPELVYYDISSAVPQNKEEKSSVYKQKYIKGKDFSVEQNFVGTNQFPEFENDMLSEQERIAQEEAAKADWEQANKAPRQQVQTARVSKDTSANAAAVAEKKEPVMSKAQLASRKNKPKRFMKEKSPETAAQQEESAPAAQDIYADTALYETGTPQAEMQDVQALNNNPSAQPAADVGGAAPDGFLEDNLMAEDPSFGYNATDPAMQP